MLYGSTDKVVESTNIFFETGARKISSLRQEFLDYSPN